MDKHEIMVMILNMLNDTTLPIEIIVAKWNELLAAKAQKKHFVHQKMN